MNIEEHEKEIQNYKAKLEYYSSRFEEKQTEIREVAFCIISAGAAVAIALTIPIYVYGLIWN